MTEEQRKESQKTMTIYMGVVFTVFFAYVCACIGSVAVERSVNVFDVLIGIFIGKYEVWYFPTFNSGIFIGGIVGILIGAFCTFYMHTDNVRNYSYKADEIAGTGGFMSEKDRKEYDKKYVSEPEVIGEPSPYMIQSNSFRRPINSRALIGNNNVLVVGGSGSGKSRFFIKPNGLQMNASYVFSDPSGEMIAALGKPLQENGYKIRVFNIADMKHSNCYNPLKYIRDAAGVAMLIDCFIRNTTKDGAKGDQFFTDAERLLYSACIFYLKDFCTDDSKKNFAHIMDMVNSSMVDENNPMAKSKLDELFEKLPESSEAWKYYKGFKQAAGKTLKSIIISCIARLQPFLIPDVINLTSTDELELEKLGQEKTALFLILPTADQTYSFLSAMLYSQAFETLYHVGSQQLAAGGSEQMKIPVRFLMDEFANTGEIPQFPQKLATMRKYNISATIVLQDLAQIEAMYKDEWRTLIGNCSSMVFLGSQETNTLKYFSEMLGKKTITEKSRGVNRGKSGSSSQNFKQTAREVMTTDELARLDKTKTIVFTQTMRPVLDKKYQYDKHPLYSKTGDADPKNKFQYVKMPMFDNTKPKHCTGILAAQSEIVRIRSLQKASEIKSTDTKTEKGDIYQAMNQFVSERKERLEIENRSYDKASEAVAECLTDPVSVAVVEGIPPYLLRSIAKKVSIVFNKTPVIIFSSMEGSEEVYGIGYDPEETELYNCMQNDYTRMKKDENGFLMIKLYRKNLETLKTQIFSKYTAA